MSLLRFTLVAEGSSDRALMPILNWTLAERIEGDIQASWADFSRLSQPPRRLEERIAAACRLFPCDVLFVHRDGDKAGRDKRVEEIRKAAAAVLPEIDQAPTAICVVPVRALEAWFFFDESAIRRAAGNPNGRNPLELPEHSRIERIADPKAELKRVLSRAGDQRRRRRRTVRPGRALHRIAELAADFSPLRALPAFLAFEEELSQALIRRGWLAKSISPAEVSAPTRRV